MSLDLPGLPDPVRDAQSVFRAVLGAMSTPGAIHRAGGGLTPPSCLAPATAAVLLTLIDAETPLCLAADLHEAADWIAFHCGARLQDGTAAFVVATALPDLAALDGGSDEAPENSVTVILQLPALGTGAAFHLEGPGLRAPATLRASGLPENFAASWAANHALFPRGVDLILCAGESLAALPRSVTVTEG
jgi:alpha-D-ribose 1-methylphosphonate 5-triphosphate synthase subunit PhnH